MVKSNDDGSNSVAPFLNKCYEMVDDESTDSIISWGQSNESFVIWDVTEFSVQLLPRSCHLQTLPLDKSNVPEVLLKDGGSIFCCSFSQGFRKIDTDRWEFANDGFVRDQKHLLNNICRRKNTQGSEQRKSLQQSEKLVEPCEKIDHSALWKEVENLKAGKNALTQELLKLRQYQETADNKLVLLRDRVQGMEKSQQQMLSFLVMAMQNPSFLVQLLQPKENNWRMAEAGTMLEEVTEVGEPIASDNMLVRYHPPIDETPKPVLKPVTDSGNQMASDTSDGMKDVFMNIDFLKMLMDENQAPFIPLDLHNDGEWEKLLLANPILDNSEDTQVDKDKEVDKEGHTDVDMEAEPAVSGSELERLNNLELLLQELDKSQNFDNELENARHLEFLTQKIELLASESNYKL
ncbi:hypothetical protein WN943_011588 [Citrus x changshan-huyou]